MLIVDGAFTAEERRAIAGWSATHGDVVRVSRYEGQVIVRFADGCRTPVIRCVNIVAALERAMARHEAGEALPARARSCALHNVAIVGH